MILDGQLGVAVSGGADSVALLHLLVEAGFSTTILHVNHCLRGAESDADQEFVSQIGAGLNMPVLLHKTDRLPGNTEQVARRARYGWFRELIRSGAVSQVATGHTLDDQAETVLFRFLRGAGTAGLAAIRPEVDGIVRPLLETRRADLRRYLESRRIAWREDSSNRNPAFRRNRIRHELLPSLEADWNPKLAVALARTADWARAEEDYWRAELPRLTADWVHFDEDTATLDSRTLAGLPVAAARRVIRYAVEHVQGDLLQVDFNHIEEIRRLPPGFFETARWRACRSGDRLRIASLPEPSRPYSLPLEVPGACLVPGSASTLHLELKPAANVYNDGGQQIDWALVSGSLELRNWQPGDRFRSAGHRTPRKLKCFFQESGIPSWERSEWPVITCDNTILWSRRLGVAADFAPSSVTREILLIHESPNQKVSN